MAAKTQPSPSATESASTLERWTEDAWARAHRWVRMALGVLKQVAEGDEDARWALFNRRVFPFIAREVGPTQPSWDAAARLTAYRIAKFHLAAKSQPSPYARVAPLAYISNAVDLLLDRAERFLDEEAAKSTPQAPLGLGVVRELLRILAGTSTDHPAPGVDKDVLAHAKSMATVDAMSAEPFLAADMQCCGLRLPPLLAEHPEPRPAP
eukprot:m51a1_g12777 hypothetical protein (209) ;mRNA; f:1931-2654